MDGGHFVVACGYDENFIYFRNSWSTEWGQNGNGWIDVSYIKNVVAIGTLLDKVQTQIVIPSPVTDSKGKVTNWYERFIDLLRNAGLFK
jgi:hypothetical protein